MSEIIDTSGFYRNEEGTLAYGAADLDGPFGLLRRELKDTYTYPVEGWSWYDSEEAARAALGG